MSIRKIDDQYLATNLKSAIKCLNAIRSDEPVLINSYSAHVSKYKNEQRRRAANNIKIPRTWCVDLHSSDCYYGPFETKEAAVAWALKRLPEGKLCDDEILNKNNDELWCADIDIVNAYHHPMKKPR
jgi:hypothetical protein